MGNSTDVIDFCIGWGPWPGEPFLDLLGRHCKLRRLSLVACRDGNIQRVIRASETGRRRILCFLDQDADYEDPDDPYARLAYAAKDGGAFVVNDPDHARLGANKAVLHYHFERAGIPVPYTVVVRNWEPGDFRLTTAERRRLGSPFIIKPARGFGKQGVALVHSGSVQEIARARRFDRGDDFLLQERIVPRWFGHHMGWFRVFYVLGQVVMCWWDTVTEHYACVTRGQFAEHRLHALCEIAWRIGLVTEMNLFSTELAMIGRSGRSGRSGRRVMAIDYLNDPCDMTLRRLSHCGVPDEVVEHVAERLVEAAWRVKRGGDAMQRPSIWFPE